MQTFSNRILFVGSLDWRPNLDAVRLLLEEVFPAVRREVPTARLLARESEAQRMADPARGRQWRIVNPNRLNSVGQPTGYRLTPNSTPVLLASSDAAVSKRFGVYKQKNVYGKKSLGIERTTFVIDKTGRIATIYPKVKVEGHIQDILSFIGED